MKNILLPLFALSLALPAVAVTPRVLLECEVLQVRYKGLAWSTPYSAGWEKSPTGYLRPFNCVPAGTLELKTAFRLKAGERVTIGFLDKSKTPLRETVYAGKGATGEVVRVDEVFVQSGAVKYLALTPTPGLNVANLLVGGARVTLDYALWDDEPFTVAPGATRVRAPQADLLTPPYAYEFSAWVDDRTAFTFAGIDLKRLYAYTPGLWYRFRFEVDAAGRAHLKLNGREIARDLAPNGFAFANVGAEPLKVDWVRACALESPANYPAPPVAPVGEEKHLVGINICSLWREGHHWGWNCVDRAGRPKPVLGFYDEGIPESADWEIKWFVEHGVDFQAFCWYADSDTDPIRRPRLDYQLEDGFKNARYADRMKYCLIWEIQNAGRPHTLEAWKKNFVPYFIEHHFKDPRYLVLDGRPVLSIFGAWNFSGKAKGFGSAETTREAFAYLREEVKKYGFKDVILVASHWGNVKAAAQLGFDIQLPYNFGGEGYRLDYNKTCNESRLAAAQGTGIFTPPAVAVGFDNYPWGGTHKPMMSPADFEAMLVWMRDDFGPRTWKKGTWQENFQWICTWNEYGEGTYIMPTEDERGFGYLDAVRKTFTSAPVSEACNPVPTAEQRTRITSLYPQAPYVPLQVTLSFDDGNKAHYTVAAAELEKRGWRGLFCIVTDWIGQGPKAMTWDDVRDLVRRGHDIATHTLSHPNLAQLAQAGNTNEIRRQIVESCAKIKAETGYETHLLCLPGTQFTPEVIAITRALKVEPMLVPRECFGDFPNEPGPVIKRQLARGCARTDFLVHGLSPETGGWKPFKSLQAFTDYLDAIQAAEKAGTISVGPYQR